LFHVVLACYSLLVFSFYFFFKPLYIIMVLNWAFDIILGKEKKEFIDRLWHYAVVTKSATYHQAEDHANTTDPQRTDTGQYTQSVDAFPHFELLTFGTQGKLPSVLIISAQHTDKTESYYIHCSTIFAALIIFLVYNSWQAAISVSYLEYLRMQQQTTLTNKPTVLIVNKS
uniref:Ion_trans domain-containing protein n=1 Tax=Angiostrongylus cantonensis TaxID=6313 RepID=A0A0K0DFJ2_ANGCA